jgi:tRNA threonylcarbamoyladenosine biosynthesis protein TsaE
MEQYLSESSWQTFCLGRDLGKRLQIPAVICLFGDLAAGKTTFIKGIVEAVAHIDPSEVQSPTFTYLHIYKGQKKVYHFDLYRLRDIDEFLSMGFDEYWEADGVCCMEWSERIHSYLPPGSISVTLSHAGEDKRLITIEGLNEESTAS